MFERLSQYLSPAVKYWIFLVGIIVTIFTVIFGSFAASYMNLSPADQDLARTLFDKLIPFPFLGSMLLVIIICTLVSLIFRAYIIPVLKMAEQTRLITSVNPDHRIKTTGSREMVQLAEVINESADAYQKLQSEVEEKIHANNLALKQERNRFAALMSELPFGVIVCNSDGTILLYNRKAQEMLQQTGVQDTETAGLGGTLGLGRSIFGLLDREPVVHTLEVMNLSHAHGQVQPALGLMTKFCHQRFIRVNMAPVTSQDNGDSSITGFVLSLEDITGEIEADSERDRNLQQLIDSVQSSLGQIHSGVATICQMPGVGGEACDLHRRAINRVTADLEAHLALARELYTQHRRALGKRENVAAETLRNILSGNLQQRFGIDIESVGEASCWLNIDSYGLIQAISNLAGLLKAEHNIKQLRMTYQPGDSRDELHLKISWPGRTIPCQAVTDWQQAPLFMAADGTSTTPQKIFTEHGGQLHAKEQEPGHCVELDLVMPTALTEAGEELRSLIAPRPISYEFDLFHQPGQQALADIPLNKLTYVAFDTETTGLNPSEGDEIIQIGAIRIVNGRTLPNEVVDQLVNPQRPVPPSSVKVHGIQPELLDNQPTIESVLPRFHAFAHESVLVAHNAAFDMRFLQLKQEITGLTFDNPVLDTLLLSSVVHPHQESHSLDAVAERMNINIVGRHTALGDALVTAEVLLKLIPLLEAQGIRTLADAIDASAKSSYAKIKY